MRETTSRRRLSMPVAVLLAALVLAFAWIVTANDTDDQDKDPTGALWQAYSIGQDTGKTARADDDATGAETHHAVCQESNLDQMLVGAKTPEQYSEFLRGCADGYNGVADGAKAGP